MSENRIAQHGVGQSTQHCCLNGSHHYPMAGRTIR
jgi:hypothetical protein